MINRRNLLCGLSPAAMAPKVSAQQPYGSNALIGDHPDFEIVSANSPNAFHYSRSFLKDKLIVPARRIMCKTPHAVARAIEYVRENEAGFSIRSTGHCFAGHSQHSDLVIDTSRLSYVKPLDERYETVEIGAGTWLGTVYRALADHDRTICGGTYDSVGAGGTALGGGLGYYARQNGLLIDHVLAYTMVDARGEIFRASADENADLFWALRGGGGGSFGVVTSFEVRTIHMPRLTSINILWTVPNQEALKIAYLWQKWSGAGERRTTTYLQIIRYVNGTFILHLTGTSSDVRDVVLRNLKQLLGNEFAFRDEHVIDGSLKASHQSLLGDHHQLAPAKVLVSSDMIATEISPDGMLGLFEKMLEYPADTVVLNFEALGGAVRDVGVAETAYPHREAAYAIYYISDIRRPELVEQRTRALDEFRSTIKPFTTDGIYVNYPQPGLDNWQKRYWGVNFERLVEVKRKWDSGNVFNHAQSVPLQF